MFLTLVLALAGPSVAATCYVNAAATGSNDGTSWANAYTDLQSALANYGTCLAVFVARGTYKPTATTDRTISFNVRPNVFVYGGFAGTEAQTTDRLLQANETILSGDIGVAADSSDNSYHVVVFDGTTASGNVLVANTGLSDFTIRDGNANGAGTNEGNGGGIFCSGSGAGHECSPQLAHLIVENNAAQVGAGIYDDGHASGKSSPWLHDSIVRDNHTATGASNAAGGMYNGGSSGGVSSPLIEQVTFSGNSSDLGGAMYNYGLSGTSSPTIRNSTFYANTAKNSGGAILDNGASNGHASPILRYSTFTQNRVTAGTGGAIYNIAPGADAAPNISGVIFWGDQPNEDYTSSSSTASVIEYSIMPSCPGGAIGCISADPLLRPLADNDAFGPTLMPDVGSPAIDAGNATNCPASDARGVSRPQPVAGVCDIGAIELTAADKSRCYVSATASGSGNGQSWANAYQTIYSALIANCTEVWVAKSPTSYAANNLLDAAAFSIPPGKALYGGFAGTETQRSQRDPVANETILNGLGMPHVVALDAPGDGKNIGGSTVLDGFTITGGNASSTGLSAYGGGLICNGNQGYVCSPTLANLVLKDNGAVEAGAMFLNGAGGVSSPTLQSVTFSGNQASTQCGAFEANGQSGGVSEPVLTNVTFANNNASSSGGAACFIGAGGISRPVLETALFDHNTAGTSGGAIAADASDLTLSHVTFRNNQAASGTGGAIDQTDADGTSSAQLYSVAFAANGGYSNGGGALFNYVRPDSTARLERTTFASNISGANSAGGGLAAQGGTVTVVDSLFTGNVASAAGGGAFGATGTLTIDRSAFVGNSATSAGGAFYGEGDTTTISNSSFRDNVVFSSIGGGAIAVRSHAGLIPGNLLLLNSTLTRNNAPSGGALYVGIGTSGVESQAAVSDSIIWGNTAATDPEIHHGTNGSFAVDHSILEGGCPLGPVCNVALNVDPNLLANFQIYGSGLTPLLMPNVRSPAIDTGSSCTSLDQRGVARPQGGACDMGAAELAATDDTLFNDNFAASDFEPAGYDPMQCASVANSLDVYWVEVDGSSTCVGIEHTNGRFVDAAANGGFTDTGLSVSNSCLEPAAYSFTLSPDGRTLSGSDTKYGVPMTLTRSSDGNCFVGHWKNAYYDFIATIWNFTRQ